jgi:hypothetical protein
MIVSFNVFEDYKQLAEKEGTGAALLFAFLMFSITFFLGGYCLQYVFQYWIGVVRDNPVVIPFFACGLAACFTKLSELYLTLFIVTWLVKLAN